MSIASKLVVNRAFQWRRLQRLVVPQERYGERSEPAPKRNRISQQRKETPAMPSPGRNKSLSVPCAAGSWLSRLATTHHEKVTDDATWAVPCNKYGCVTSDHRSLSVAHCLQVALRNLDTSLHQSIFACQCNFAEQIDGVLVIGIMCRNMAVIWSQSRN